MSNTGIPNSVPKLTARHIGVLIGVLGGMVVLMYIFRFVINIFVIDICILGDCSAWKKICCWLRNNREEDDNGNDGDAASGASSGGPMRWRARDAVILQTMGAFTDPVSFLYSSETFSQQKREQFLKIITDAEVSEFEHVVSTVCLFIPSVFLLTMQFVLTCNYFFTTPTLSYTTPQLVSTLNKTKERPDDVIVIVALDEEANDEEVAAMKSVALDGDTGFNMTEDESNVCSICLQELGTSVGLRSYCITRFS